MSIFIPSSLSFRFMLMVFLILPFVSTAQLLNPQQTAPAPVAKSLVQWKSLQEAFKLQEETKKPLFIDAYTDWCGWCKKMDAETFNHPAIAEFINFFYIPVKFNAEGSDTIEYKGKKYFNEGKGPRSTHQFAIQLLQGRMSYPTIVYLDAEGVISPIPGYRNPQQIEPFLIYFAEGMNKSSAFDDFQKGFDRVFRDSTPIPELVKWHRFDEALELNLKNPKKILAIVYSKFNKGSTVMLQSTFADTLIANYINKNYYLARIEAESTDTIKVGEQTFMNELKMPNYPHQLAIALLQGKMAYPASIYLDETNQMVNRINGYFSPKGIEPILHFFAENIYKNTQWEVFLKDFKSGFPVPPVNGASSQ